MISDLGVDVRWRGRGAAVRSAGRALRCHRSVPVTISAASARSRSSVELPRARARAPPAGPRRRSSTAAQRVERRRRAPGAIMGRSEARAVRGRRGRRGSHATRHRPARLPAAARRSASARPSPGRHVHRRRDRRATTVPGQRGVGRRCGLRRASASTISRAPSEVGVGVRPGIQPAHPVVDARARAASSRSALRPWSAAARRSRSVSSCGSSVARCRRPARRRPRRAACAPSSRQVASRPRRWSRRARSARVALANIAPASSVVPTRMIVTPVSVSPSITARCTGAAPRYFGSSDACTLIMPEARHVRAARRESAARRRRPRRGRAPQRASVACDVRVAQASRAAAPAAPCSTRQRLDRRVGDLLAAAPRPIGLRDDAETAWREPSSASSVGTANCGVPKKTTRERAAHHLPARASFWILRTIRSFCRPRSRSTNSVPSR